jgi:hypothetical protein
VLHVSVIPEDYKNITETFSLHYNVNKKFVRQTCIIYCSVWECFCFRNKYAKDDFLRTGNILHLCTDIMLTTNHFLRRIRYVHLHPVYTATLRSTLACLPCWKFKAIFAQSYDVSNSRWKDMVYVLCIMY